MPTIKGIAYPLKIKDGGLEVVSDTALLRSHIYSVLTTYKQERILNPAFGLPQMVFTSIPAPSVITERIRSVLKLYVPSVSFSVVINIQEGGVVNVKVDWAVNQLPQPSIEYLLS